MDFKPIKDILHRKGLKGPTLEVLHQDAKLYLTLLLQLTEAIEYTDKFIRIANRELAKRKFNQFFKIAIEENVELAVTPEYSCPWSVIKELINDNRLPKENKIWIVGCESIHAKELLDIIKTQNQIEWIYDEELVKQNISSNHFFDPVCYLFKTRTHGSNELRTLVLVQFKNCFMGGIEWERDNFIFGDKIYVLQNETPSSRLFTLICSDALNVSSPQFYQEFMNLPHLIIHIQLNKSPNNPIFRNYRCNLFNAGWENKEVLCLNWARHVKMNNTHFNNYGGTSFYTQSKKIELNDARIEHNHKLGAYYTYWKERRTSNYLFNFDENVFCFRNTKPSQIADSVVQRKRTGLEMFKVLTWNINKSVWDEITKTNSGFLELCNGMRRRDTCNILTCSNIENVNIERLISLSTGKATTENWYQVQENEFFKIDDDGINKRMTFTHDPCPETYERRKNFLIQFARLANHIINNHDYFPDTIADLKGNCKVDYRPNGDNNSYNINLFPIDDNGSRATGIYKGETDKATALETFERTKKLFNDSQNGARIVVWYRDAEGYENVSGNKPKIPDNPSIPINSIRSTRR